MTRRLSWIVAAPLLAAAVVGSAMYAAAIWAFDTLCDFDEDDE